MTGLAIFVLAVLGIQWLFLVPYQLRQLFLFYRASEEAFILRRNPWLTIIVSICFIVFTIGLSALDPLSQVDLISEASSFVDAIDLFGVVITVSIGVVKIYSSFYDHMYNVELSDVTWISIITERRPVYETWYIHHAKTFGNVKFTLLVALFFGAIPCIIYPFNLHH